MNYIYKDKLVIIVMMCISIFVLKSAENKNLGMLYDEKNLVQWLPQSILQNQEYKQKVIQWCKSEDVQYFRQYKIDNNHGDEIFYGRTFPTLVPIEFAFLTYLKDIQKNATVIEFAAANGKVAFKAVLALSGTHSTVIVNDLSQKEINKAQELFSSRRLSTLSDTQTVFDYGNATHFLERHPEYKEKIDAIYIQCAEHFMNPQQHQQFVKTVHSLLKPGGRIFCTANTIYFGCGVKGNPFFDEYIKYKKTNNKYPMFFEAHFDNYQDTITQAFLKMEMTKVSRPDETSLCDGYTKTTEMINVQLSDGTQKCVAKNSSVHLQNAFTPTIYAQAYGDKFTKVDGFFLNVSTGNYYRMFDNNKNINLAAAIFEKNKNS